MNGISSQTNHKTKEIALLKISQSKPPVFQETRFDMFFSIDENTERSAQLKHSAFLESCTDSEPGDRGYGAWATGSSDPVQ